MAKKTARSDVHVKGADGKPVEVKTTTVQELATFVENGGTVVGTGASGEEYMISSNQYLIKPDIDGKLIFDLSLNKYVAKGVEGLINLCFTKKEIFHVYNGEGVEDQEVAGEMLMAFEMPGVELFSKMKLSAKDIYQWGIFLYQLSWQADMDGWVVPSYLKRLPPESFTSSPPKYAKRAEILKGICLNEAGNVEYWQLWNDNQVHQLSDVKTLKDPTMPGLAGQSRLVPLVPLIRLIDFCWKAQSQKINRVGAPALFVKFSAPPVVIPNKRDDLKLARLIIDNWGKEAQYILRENMEIVQLDFPDNQSSIQTIDELRKDIMEHFNPATFLIKEGDTIGGSDSGKVNLIKLAIQNANAMIEDIWEPLAQEFLQRNGYEGYKVELEIPAPEPDRSAVNVQRAEVGDKMNALTLNEKRQLLGFPEATDEIREELEDEMKKKAAMTPGVFRPGSPPFEESAEGAESEESAESDADTKEFQSFEELKLFPYPNEHAARMMSPDKFDKFRRKKSSGGPDVIWGHLKGKGPDAWAVQAYRFPTSRFTAAEARSWLKKHNKSPSSFHPASG